MICSSFSNMDISCQVTTQEDKKVSDNVSDHNIHPDDDSSSEDSEQEHLSDPFWIQNFSQTAKALLPEETRGNGATCLKQPTKKRRRTQAERIARAAEKLQLRTPCNPSTCKLNCCNKISLEERNSIFEKFKKMSDHEKKCWVFQRVTKEFVKRKTTTTLRRKFTLSYSLDTSTGSYPVCKVFFLSTLGFNRKNDRIVTTAIKTLGNAATCLKQPTKKRCRTQAERIARDAEKLQLRTPCDSSTCKLNCCNKISLEERNSILEKFKKMSDHEKKCWVFARVTKEFVKRKTTTTLRRKFTLSYSLDTSTGCYPVCKVFFLSTLGFNPKNDRIVTTAIKTAGLDSIAPPHSQRGRKTPPNKIDRDPMRNHILSYVPSIHHNRSEDASKDSNPPSELTAYGMHKDYLKKHPDKPCSYKIYLKEMTSMNLNFTKHKQKQCAASLGDESRDHSNHDISLEPTDADCNACTSWETHLQKINEAWIRYKTEVEKALQNPDPYHIVRSLNLQKSTSQSAS